MKLTYAIEGMHCEACIQKIKSALNAHQINVVEISLYPPQLQIDSDSFPSLTELNTSVSEAGNYRLKLIPNDSSGSVSLNEQVESPKGIQAYYPLFLIAAYIIGVAFINNLNSEGINWQNWMNQFMAGFFLVFSAFKFLDLRGFAEGYATYDLLAKRWPLYGFIYPFLELGLGILYLGNWLPVTTYLLTIIIMGFSSLGVINSLLKKQKLQCACLGTILKVPLSSITLVEDLTMVAMAALALAML